MPSLFSKLNLIVLGLLVFLIMSTSLALAQEQLVTTAATTQPVQVLGQIGGVTKALVRVGNRVYSGEGPRIAVLDVTDPAQPQLVGKSALLTGVVQAIAVVGNTLYAASEGGLHLIDLAEPTAPRVIGHYVTPDWAWDVAVVETRAYVATGGSGLLIIDVSTPATPTLLGSLATQNYANGVVIVGTTAYVADAAGSGLRIINVANPAQPVEIGSYVTPGVAFDVAVAGNFAYVADYTQGLRVINIVNPAQPVEIGSFDSAGYAVGVTVDGNRAYLADNHGGLAVLDVTNPAAPQLRQLYDTPGRAIDVAVAGDLVYVADEGAGLQIGNTTGLTRTVPVGAYRTVGDARGVFVADHTAFVADGAGLVTVDVTTPTLPSRIGAINTLGGATEAAAASIFAYVADGAAGLQIISDLDENPHRRSGGYDTPGSAQAVVVQNERAYVADGAAGLSIVSVANSVNPSELGIFDTPGDALDLFVAGNRTFLADSGSGLRLLNTANPAAITQLTAYQTASNALGVYAVGNTAYVAAGSAGLRVIDVSNLSNPAEVGFYDTPGYAEAVHVVGTLAYVADNDAGLRVLDVTNPARPSEVGAFQAPSAADDVFVSDSTVYVAYGQSGLWILRYPPCYGLTRRTTGSGVAPTATPPNSAGCPVGEYHFLESISLSANPDPGWRIVSWVGTNNDNTSSRNNTLTMPAADQEVVVNYAPTCYTLTLGHAGTGADPTATPANSTGCAAGQYAVNESVTLRAAPSTGYTVGSWSGTANNSSSALDNSFTMPAGNHTAGVTYVLACYPLTLNHSGSGADPTATPGQSEGCSAGRYHFNQTISFSAAPAQGWQINSWSGTSNNAATAATNSLTMPPNDHTVSVNYGETPVAGPGDNYESDDGCTRSRLIATDGVDNQSHTFHQVSDADWVRFTAAMGKSYRIEVQVPISSTADVNLEVYAQCETPAFADWKASFSPEARLDVQAPASGQVYVRLANQDANSAGERVRYNITVRQLESNPTNRALILVAGRLKGADSLQKNIHNVTNAVYTLFQRNGYDDDHIYYLATDANLPGHDAALTKESLRTAITQWAKDKVSSDGVLTLYLMDHGNPEIFYLDDLSNQRLSPDELNGWLSELEAAAPNVKINVFIEACQSGSFITKPGTISKAGRIVITSTNAENDAKASKDGAYFSDHLLTALHQGYNLSVAFSEASNVARTVFSLQQAMLDSDGNGIPNEFGDAINAARRSFAYAGSLGNEWPPHIFSVQPPTSVANFRGVIQADVRDNVKVRQVWAVVYPPDYQPPPTGQELQPETLPTFLFNPLDNANLYAGEFTGFTQSGVYRIVVHAEDADGLVARPVVLEVNPTGGQVFLPVVGR